MKTKALILALSLVLAINGKNIAGPKSPETTSNYVVIGAFAIKEHAITWVESAKKINLQAEFEKNLTRNLYYVYVMETLDKGEAVVQAKKIRVQTRFNDTWVYTGILGESKTIVKGEDINPVTEEEIVAVEPVEDIKSEQPVDEVSEVKVEDQKTIVPLVDETVVTKADAPADEVKKEAEEGGRGFIFKAVFEGAERKGEVDLIDGVKLTKVATYESNKRVYIRPVNKSGKMEVQCKVFGYRKAQVDFNYTEPQATPGISLEGENVVIPFDLVRLKKGDFAILYNVFFFKDAAIMRPESQYEIGELLAMMNSNSKLKIRLHGHTNGGAAGKIIKMGDKKNFFSLSGSTDGFGTAKALSEERAGVIREYLISEGIDASRVEIKAWGGKRPIHDKKSNKAHENVRVEVEIVAD